MREKSTTRKRVSLLAVLAFGWFGMFLMQWYLTTRSTIETIPYSRFEELVAQGVVTDVVVGKETIEGKLKDKLADGKSALVTARVDMPLAEKLASKGISVTGAPSDGWFGNVVSWVVPLILLYGFWYVMAGRLGDRQGVGSRHGHRNVSRQSLCRERHQSHVRGRGGCRRGEGRGRRVPRRIRNSCGCARRVPPWYSADWRAP